MIYPPPPDSRPTTQTVPLSYVLIITFNSPSYELLANTTFTVLLVPTFTCALQFTIPQIHPQNTMSSAI